MSVGRLIPMGASILAVFVGAASPLVPEGRIYALHSKAAGRCPSLDWYIVVEANDIVAGMIAWDDMKTMVSATRKVNRKSNTFTMKAIEIGGQARVATVDGQIKDSGTVIANIKGPNVTCNSVIIRPYGEPDNAR